MAQYNSGQPSDALRGVFGDTPTLTEMIENSGRTMEQRLGGRPALPESDRKRTTSVSLTPRALSYLAGFEQTSGMSRSELIEMLISITQRDPEALLAAIRGDAPSAPPLTEIEIQTAAAIANAALGAWISPDRTLGEVGDAMDTFFAAAVRAIRANR